LIQVILAKERLRVVLGALVSIKASFYKLPERFLVKIFEAWIFFLYLTAIITIMPNKKRIEALSNDTMESVFHAYYPRLCHFASQFIADPEQHEDIVQDAFMAYWKNRKSIAEDANVIKSFLYATVRNICFNQLRKDKVITRFQLLNRMDEIEDAEILNKIIRSEVMAEIYRVLKTLPPGIQEVFRLGYLEGLNNHQIAEELGVSVNTVKTQKQRGLKVLKGKLNPELFLLISCFLLEK